MKERIEQIAKVCHEANRAYCSTLGDDSQPIWENAPDWQLASAIKGVEFHIDHLKKGSEPSPSASHDSWLKQKQEEGWTYGLVKDPEKKEHPCVMPYGELPVEQRLKDYIFAAIVKAFWEAQTTEVAQALTD